MTLRSARLTGDPVLESCLDQRHRMMEPEEGVSVMRVQRALLDLGRSVGPAGADGRFGPDTGAAVTVFKTDRGLTPNDPVVGPGTTRALDDELLIEPPELDPTFGELSGAVVEHRLEQFVALELGALRAAPLDSCRHMLGRFAADALSTGELLGILGFQRAVSLRDRFLAVADETQLDPRTGQPIAAADFFDDAASAGGVAGLTVTFRASGELRSFILVDDQVILGRGAVTRDDGSRAPLTLEGVIVHELTHARNLANIQGLLETPDDDADVYADVPLAQARSATGTPTARTLRSFVAELTARHVHWIVQREHAGAPAGIALRSLTAEQLALAANLFFVSMTRLYDVNDYGAGVNAQGDAVRWPQLDRWLRVCANQSFSSNPGDDEQSTLAFQDAAAFAAAQADSPDPDLDFAEEDGIFPLFKDFT